MNKKYSLAVFSACLIITGCAQVDRYQGDVRDWWAQENIFLENAGQKRRAESARYRVPPTYQLMSNQNVTVYPLDGPVQPPRQYAEPTQRPQQQSLIKSSVAFDPSVEVYALDDNQGRPSYVPNYAVPSYGPMDSAALGSMEQTKPEFNMAPIQMTQPVIPNTIKQNNYTSTDLMNDIQKEPLAKTPGRRSRPVLTAYD